MTKGATIETKKLAGTTNRNGTSFFSDMESGIIAVLSSISETFFECDKTNHELSNAVNTVVGMVGNISEFIRDIENIGMEMELLSLNARIKAAHTGDEGAGLAVLAEAVQQLSTDVCEKTNALSNIFNEVTAAAADLNGSMNSERNEMNSQIEEILMEMEGLLENLRGNNSNILSSLTGIGEECQRLGCDIEEAVSEIKIDQIINSLEKVISGLNYISRQTVTFSPLKSDFADTSGLFKFNGSANNVELF